MCMCIHIYIYIYTHLYVIMFFFFLLQNAFSLLAYTDPWNSPVGWQLDPLQREPVCQSLNSAILGKFTWICDLF